MSDLTDEIDDHEQRLSTVEENQSTDEDTLQTQDDTLSDHESRLTDVEGNSGQLTFPLTQDTIDLIKEQFPSGVITLVAGVATITDDRISTTSVILLSVPNPGGTQGFLSYLATAGQAVITSTSNTDTSDVAYMILN